MHAVSMRCCSISVHVGNLIPMNMLCSRQDTLVRKETYVQTCRKKLFERMPRTVVCQPAIERSCLEQIDKHANVAGWKNIG